MVSSEWCEASERRLMLKLLKHKPIGINRSFHLNMLVDYMNHIYEDEDDINFEEYLSEKDFEILKQRKLGKLDGKHAEEIMAFPPSYSIRPTGFQVEEKLREQYNLELLHKSEPKPVELETPSDFLMPASICIMPSTGLSIFSTDHDGGYEGASDYQPDDPLSSRSTFYRLGLGFSGIIDHVAHQMSLKSSPRKRNLRDKKK